MPSPRPVKPSLLAGRRLHRHAIERKAGKLGDLGAHGVAVRPDLGRLAHQRQVEMGDAPAARFHALDREGEEPVGGRALPLRIAGREMRADIAVGQRAENGVGQRVQAHIGVGMAGELVRVRDAHAAQHDMIAGREGVHVDAGAGAHVAKLGELRRLRARAKSSGWVILILPGSPANTATFMPAHSASAASSVKSSRPAAAALRCAASKGAKAKACGVWIGAQVFARQRLLHEALRVDRLDRVGDGQARHRRAVLLRGRDRARDQRGAREGAGGVMHQHDVGLARGQRLQAGAHRGLPRGAAEGRRQRSSPAAAASIERAILGPDHRLHPRRPRDASTSMNSVRRSMGSSPIRRNCLGRSPPVRVPRARGHHHRCHVRPCRFRSLSPLCLARSGRGQEIATRISGRYLRHEQFFAVQHLRPRAKWLNSEHTLSGRLNRRHVNNAGRDHRFI